jgi:integrase
MPAVCVSRKVLDGCYSLRIRLHDTRSCLDAVGTGIVVQQKLMRHTDIRTTMNVYGDVVTDEEAQAHTKVVSYGCSEGLVICVDL